MSDESVLFFCRPIILSKDRIRSMMRQSVQKPFMDFKGFFVGVF